MSWGVVVFGGGVRFVLTAEAVGLVGELLGATHRGIRLAPPVNRLGTPPETLGSSRCIGPAKRVFRRGVPHGLRPQFEAVPSDASSEFEFAEVVVNRPGDPLVEYRPRTGPELDHNTVTLSELAELQRPA